MSDIDNLRLITKNTINKYVKNDILAEDIENSINTFTFNNISEPSLIDVLFENIYDQKSREILEYFKINGENLLKAFQSEQLDPKKLADYKAEDLNPEKYSKMITKKSYSRYITNKGSNLFTCPKCKKSNCEVTQKQTRSGDEPPTTFVKCLVCNNVMKF